MFCTLLLQVKRYIDVYSASSMIGFSSEDLLHISDIYNQAEGNWSNTKNFLLYKNEPGHSLLPALRRQIDAYSNFLSNVSELARSKWTEFNLRMMGIGLAIMLMSLFIIFLAIWQSNRPQIAFPLPSGDSRISFDVIFAFFIVAIRACSLFSNSYICKFWPLMLPRYFPFFLSFPLILLTFHFFLLNLELSGGRKSGNFSVGHNWHCQVTMFSYEEEDAT